MDRDGALDLLLRDPRATAILTDFDGTLAPIVDRPEAAAPAPGALAALESLARAFALVAVVSGRALDDLAARFSPSGVVLLGSYGRERSDDPGPRPGEDSLAAVAAASSRTRGMPGVWVERKPAGVALHFRRAPELGTAVAEAAAEIAREFGLEVRPGRMVVELTAPGPGKGAAVAALLAERGPRAALYAGDDRADLEAFDAVRTFGSASLLVAVASDESPAELEHRADLVLAAPHEFVAFLADLASASGGG